MKKISLWATALVSAFFVIMVCIDSHNWELLGVYASIIAVWMFLGWYRVHWSEFKHDLYLLSNIESPFKFEWVGTFVFLGIIAILVIALIIGALLFIVSQGLKWI